MSESYQALYRKWRPMSFGDIVGQSHISETLKSGVANGRIAHAYLFCGTRGTGKTSTAKIFARAVNCENPKDGEPCNECPTCRGILDGSILDVYEMDAASNRGVDNIREIRDEVFYTPAGCTYKVYIIDEVHMLTPEAFNAILKTLEEPPKHAIFILATTEPHKLPATILSRCQRYDFRRIGVDDIARRLTKIAESETISITSDALEIIAELGDGSMRDALSILDQCAACKSDGLTKNDVTEIVGIADTSTLFAITDAIAAKDVAKTLIQIDSFLNQGKEVLSFFEDFIDHFRMLMISKACEHPEVLIEKTTEAAEKYKMQAETLTIAQILYSIRILSELHAQAKWMPNPKTAADMAAVKLCMPQLEDTPDALLSRITKLEQALAGKTIVSAPTTDTFSDSKPAVNMPPGNTTIKTTPAASANMPPWDDEQGEQTIAVQSSAQFVPPSDSSFVADTADTPPPSSPNDEYTGKNWALWAEALQEIKNESKKLFAFMYRAAAYKVGNTIEVELGTQLAYDKISTPDGLKYLSALFSRVSGENLQASAYIKGQKNQGSSDEKTEKPSILDIAGKKDLLGDKMHIKES